MHAHLDCGAWLGHIKCDKMRELLDAPSSPAPISSLSITARQVTPQQRCQAAFEANIEMVVDGNVDGEELNPEVGV